MSIHNPPTSRFFSPPLHLCGSAAGLSGTAWQGKGKPIQEAPSGSTTIPNNTCTLADVPARIEEFQLFSVTCKIKSLATKTKYRKLQSFLSWNLGHSQACSHHLDHVLQQQCEQKCFTIESKTHLLRTLPWLHPSPACPALFSFCPFLAGNKI